jgi:LysR family glycine cleavage system transcriptional activator
MGRQRPPRLSLDLLRGFRAAARYLSFTQAAQELSLTQSAISQEVKALEEQLGAPLFTRVNRTLRLTQAGEQLYRAADEALALIDAAAEQVAGAARSLSITTTVPFASLWLGPRLHDFARRHPDIRLRVVASNDNLDIAREHIDIAIRHTPNDVSPPSGDCIFEHETFPVCSPSLLQQAARPIASAADLASHVLLDLETIRNGRPWYDWQLWLDAMKVRGLKPAGYLRFSHYDQVIAAAISGAGIAIGRWPHLASQLRQRVLVAPMGDAGVAHLGRFHLVVRGGATPGPVEAFLSWLRAEADEDTKKRAKATSTRRPSARRAGARATGSRR